MCATWSGRGDQCFYRQRLHDGESTGRSGIRLRLSLFIRVIRPVQVPQTLPPTIHGQICTATPCDVFGSPQPPLGFHHDQPPQSFSWLTFSTYRRLDRRLTLPFGFLGTPMTSIGLIISRRLKAASTLEPWVPMSVFFAHTIGSIRMVDSDLPGHRRIVCAWRREPCSHLDDSFARFTNSRTRV